MTMRLLIAILTLFIIQEASPKPEFAPGTRYDARIPTLKAVLGREAAERVTPPEEIIRYLKSLNEAAPDRTKLVKYAETWEGRELYALIIGSPERMRRIDQIKAGLQQLAAGASSGETDRLVRELPVVVALVHGVHGNEISSGEAAMMEAYHLLAAQGDARVEAIRREAIVIVDPMQNPDGRARFVFQNLLGQAAWPDPDPASAEHDEPWPGGRSNHYLFDLNRDWFAQTQPESRGRVRFLLEWMPHVVADLHEMGGNSTYYFPPGADPANPFMTAAQRNWLETIGRENAARFDERGFLYFNREVYDAFYPGYGVSWPMAQGAVGMTFEKASARGLIYRRGDGSLLTYRDGAVEHFTAAISSAHTAAINREKILRDYAEFRRNAGDGETKAYLIPEGTDPGQTRRLVRTLIDNGIVVERAEGGFSAAGRSFPAGTYIVPLPQPAGMLARNLLDQNVQMDKAFLTIQEERRKRRLPDQIYDTTAWNMPLLNDVECVASSAGVSVGKKRLRAADVTPNEENRPVLTDARVGYALQWGPTSAGATIEALRDGLTARFTSRSFTIDGRRYDGGTVIFRTADNGLELKTKLSGIAARHGVVFSRIDSAFATDGTSIGSNQVIRLKTPRVLLAWDAPTSSLSAGWARYVIERRYGQPVTAVRVNSLSRIELSKFDVLILPSGNYSFGPEPLRRIRDWVNAGGTLITIAEASRWATREGINLLGTNTELRGGAADAASQAERQTQRQNPLSPSAYNDVIQPAREQPELVPGAILRVQLDTDHWLSAGTDGEIQAMVESTRVFSPIKLDRGRNVGIYQVYDRLVASGIVWPESRNQLPQKAYLIHQPAGQGKIIAFAEDPNYRAYAESTQFLFINAILLGTVY
ncbi:MAG: M14 family metallopeptidase [Blastocatellales bacterium]